MSFLDDGTRVFFDQVHWGTHGCKLLRTEEDGACPRAAELLWDCLENEGTPACIECIDLLLERQAVLSSNPAVTLPPLYAW